MSDKLWHACWLTDVPSTQLTVLLALCHVAHDDGWLEPLRYDQLAHVANCSLATVRRVMDYLVERGVVRVASGGWRIDLSQLPVKPPYEGEESDV